MEPSDTWLTGATFDPTGLYRYSLWRVWNPAGIRVVFIMLNPSTADAGRNDPTIRRCLKFAQQWGYGALEVVNLFAYRTSSPIALRHIENPVGIENDCSVLEAVLRSDCTVVAWGNGGSFQGRDRIVLDLLAQQPALYCLGITRLGQPRHPLYVKANTRLLPLILDALPGE